MNIELKPRRDLFPLPAPAPANDNAERWRASLPRRHVVIYQPAKSAMTSGRVGTNRWLLEYEPQSAPFIEPLMGWTGSADLMAQMRLTFPSREAAVAYAQRHGLDYEVREPTEWVKAQVRANNLIAAGAVLVHLPRETQSSFLALTLTAEPEIAPIPKTDAVLETHPEPQSARPSVPTAKQRTSEPSKAGQQLSPEQVPLLLARGDELVKRADVVSGRLFYERAADAADARAALRLGASYDPSFLAQAGIRGVRGDPALATHWYKRARDLGAGKAEALLKGLGIH